MGTGAAVVATVVSGWLYALAFPTTSWHLLAWVALVPWLVAVRTGSWRRAVALGWLWAVVASYGLNDWFPRAVSTYYLQPVWVGAAFFFGVASFTAAPAFVAFAFVWRRIAATPTAVTPLLAAAAWVAAELFRTSLLGDPWALLGYSQVPAPLFLQVAEAAGVYGTSFVLAAANAALALAVTRGADRRAVRRGLAVVGCLVAAVAAFGAARLRTVDVVAARPTPIAIVQPNLDLGSQWRPEFYGMNLAAYLRLTKESFAATPPPRLVVWPESALSFFLDDDAAYRITIARTLAPAKAELVTGGVRTADGSEPPYHNTTFLLGPDGVIKAWYDKRHLLPFAEYFPLGSVELLQRQFGRVREFTPGRPTPPLPTVAGAAGIIVCNEAFFPEPARERVHEGARLLFALANDSWVGERKYAEQAATWTAVRAIEQRRWLVRASTSGPSAVIAPSGRFVVRSDHATAAVLAGTVAPQATVTPYARWGDAFAYACLVVTLALYARRART